MEPAHEFGQIEENLNRCEDHHDYSNFRIYLKALVSYYESRLNHLCSERAIERDIKMGLSVDTTKPYLKIHQGNAECAYQRLKEAEKWIRDFKQEPPMEEEPKPRQRAAWCRWFS